MKVDLSTDLVASLRPLMQESGANLSTMVTGIVKLFLEGKTKTQEKPPTSESEKFINTIFTAARKYQRARAESAPATAKTVTANEVARARQLRGRGLSYKQIAKLMDKRYSTIISVLKGH